MNSVFVVYDHYLLEGYYPCKNDIVIYSTLEQAERYIEQQMIKWQFETWIDLKYHQFRHDLVELHKETPQRVELRKLVQSFDERPRYFGDQRDKVALAKFHAEKAAWIAANVQAQAAVDAYDTFYIDNPANLYREALAAQTIIPENDIPLLDGWRGKPRYEIIERNLNEVY